MLVLYWRLLLFLRVGRLDAKRRKRISLPIVVSRCSRKEGLRSLARSRTNDPLRSELLCLNLHAVFVGLERPLAFLKTI